MNGEEDGRRTTPDWQGKAWAPVYDQLYPKIDVCDPMISTLLDLFPDGTENLEVGVGTGRVAIPLSMAGRRVYGIDASDHMLRVLRAKKEASHLLGTTHVSAQAMQLGRTFANGYAVFNTLYAMLSLSEQRLALRSLAYHVQRGGRIVVENSNPLICSRGIAELGGWVTKTVSEEAVWVMAGQLDSVQQRVTLAHMQLSSDGIRQYPGDYRYTYLSEFELLAELEQLEIDAVWGDWDYSSYTNSSPRLILSFRHRGGET